MGISEFEKIALQAISEKPVAAFAIAALILVVIVGLFLAVVFPRSIWRWVWMADEESKVSGQPGTTSGAGTQNGTTTSPTAYRLLVIAIICVTGLFVFTMLLFVGARGATNSNYLFDDAAQVIAALSLVFTVIGTLVGTYFGIKTSGDARETAERLSHASVEASARATDTAVRTVIGAQGGIQGQALMLVVSNLHNAWNLHQQEMVLGLLTDNAEVKIGPLPSGELRGYKDKDKVGEFVQTYMPGSQVDSRNYRIEGNGVTWESTVTWQLEQANDEVKRMGVEPMENKVVVDGTAVATFEGTRITALSFTLSPATLSRMRKPNQPTEGGGPGGGGDRTAETQ